MESRCMHRAERVSDTVTLNQLVCLAKGSGPRARVMPPVLRTSMHMNIDMFLLHVLSVSKCLQELHKSNYNMRSSTPP
jgi:hypothetical protein